MKRVIAIVAALFAPMALAGGLELERNCLDCHRPGQTRGAVPLIEGQHAAYLRHQLVRFRERHRDEFPMSALAAGFDDAAIERMAASLAARRWRDAPGTVDRGAAERGRIRSDELACTSCHGPGYAGIGDMPRLAGQDSVYLQRELTRFGNGERYHPPSGTGARLYVLTDADTGAIAAYLHALPQSMDDAEPDTTPRAD